MADLAGRKARGALKTNTCKTEGLPGLALPFLLGNFHFFHLKVNKGITMKAQNLQGTNRMKLIMLSLMGWFITDGYGHCNCCIYSPP